MSTPAGGENPDAEFYFKIKVRTGQNDQGEDLFRIYGGPALPSFAARLLGQLQEDAAAGRAMDVQITMWGKKPGELGSDL